jgi:hypothetical protein
MFKSQPVFLGGRPEWGGVFKLPTPHLQGPSQKHKGKGKYSSEAPSLALAFCPSHCSKEPPTPQCLTLT